MDSSDQSTRGSVPSGEEMSLGAGPLQVLLIEDNPEDARRFEEYLEESPVEATLRHERTLEAGLEALGKDRPDVLALGLGLPDSDGLEAVAAVAGQAPEVPLVVLAGPGGMEETSRARDAGAAEHLRKNELTPSVVGRTLRWAFEQGRMQRKINQRDAWIRSIAENAAEGIFRAGPTGRIEYANDALAGFFGLESGEEMQGIDLTTFYADPAHRGQMIAEEGAEGAEVEFERPDGSTFTGLLNAEAAYRADGTVLHYDGVITDITERKEKERRLRVLSEAVGQANESVLITEGEPLDEPGPRIEYVNEAFEEMTGYSEEEVRGKTPRILQGPETDRDVLDSLRAALEAGEEWQGETVNYRKGGSPYIVQWNVAPVRGENGSITRWVSVQRDVTEEREQEEKLRRQKAYTGDILDALDDVFYVLDREGRLRRWNERLPEVTGYSEEEISQIRATDFFAEEDRAAVAASIEKALQVGQARVEASFQPKEGEPIPYELTGNRLETPEGETVVAGIGRDITDRKEAEEALKEQAAQLRGLANSIPGVVYQFFARPGGTYGMHFVSKQAEDVLGLSADEEGFFERFLDGIPKPHRESFLASIEKAVEEETPWHREVPFDRPDGERIWLLATSAPERREEELVFNGVLLDITEKKSAEEKSRRANRALKTLGQSNQALIRAESEKELLEDICDIVVEAGYRLAWVGYAEHGEQKRIRPVAQSGYEEGYLEAVTIYWREGKRGRGPTGTAVRTGRPSICQDIMANPEYEAWREDALERGYRSSAALPLRSDGEVIGALNVYADEADAFEEDEMDLLQELADDLAYGIRSLRAEKEARAERRKFKNLTESLREVVYRADPETFEVTYVNDSIERICGYGQREWLEEPTLRETTIHPEDRDRVLSRLGKLQDRSAPGVLEYRIVRKDGEVRWVEDHLSWERNEEGTVTSAIGVMYDVTERKEWELGLQRAKEEAEEANKMKSAFLANMSHEIRTPLTSILGFAEAIGEEARGASAPEEVDLKTLAQFSALIEKSGRRLMETLTSVLNLSKLEAGEMEIVLGPVDLAAEAKEAVGEFLPQAEEAGVELAADLETPVWAEADEGGFHIVLRNLLSNAIKFTETGGQVWVRARSEENLAVLEVEDTGIGMDPAKTEELFEPFNQASEGMAREYEGTGLGLAVTKEVLEQMGGQVEMQTQKGEGSRFTVRLPRAEGEGKDRGGRDQEGE